MYRASSDPRLYPPVLLVQMVKNKEFGSATGKGFYDWSDPRNPKARDLSCYQIKTVDDWIRVLK